MNPDITWHLCHLVKTKNLIPYFAGILAFISAQAYLTYNQTLLISSMNDHNFSLVLLKLGLINIVYMLILGIAREQYQNVVFMPKLKKSNLEYLTSFMTSVDPSYLKDQEKIHMIIPDGVNAIENLSLNILNVIEPVFKIASSIIALGSQVSANALGLILSTLIIFFSCGLFVLRKDYIGRKNLQKDVNKHLDIVRNLWETYIIYYLNGIGFNTTKDIIESGMTADKIIRTHKTNTYSLYWILDWLQSIISIVCAWYVFNSNISIEFFAMFYIISNVCQITWWLFCAVRDTLTSTSTWGTFETFIKGYIKLDESKLIDLTDPVQVLKEFEYNSEIRLYGDSGGGKTTWMYKKVIKLMQTYKPGTWLLLDQQMKLRIDQRPIKVVMADYITDISDISDHNYTNTLLKYAEIMGISNLINESTLHKSFIKPSGGEEKRILTLRAFLPILLGKSAIKIIFNDEITAGLDKENWSKVRKVVAEIKEKYGIKFLTIDHHDFDAPKLNVNKKTRSVKRSKPKVNFGQSNNLITKLSTIFTSGIINEDDEDKEEILVWIDSEEEPNFIDTNIKSTDKSEIDLSLDQTDEKSGLIKNRVENTIEMV